MGRSYTSRNSNSKAVHTHHEVTPPKYPPEPESRACWSENGQLFRCVKQN